MSGCSFQNNGEEHVVGFQHFEVGDIKDLEDNHKDGNVVYNVGNGNKEENKGKASRAFLEREFPFIIDGQTEALFLPNCFIHQRPDLMDVDLSSEEIEEHGPEQKAEIEKCKSSIRGDRAEYWMYEMLREFFHGTGKDENKDVMVFHGWKSNWLQKGSKKANGEEFDFLVTSKLHKIIMNIEVKNTLSGATIKSLCKQLPRKAQFFLKRYNKHLESQGWTFLKVAASPSASEEIVSSICDTCKQFLISKDTDFGQWWLEILDIIKKSRAAKIKQLSVDKNLDISKHEGNLYTLIAQDMIGLAHTKEFFNTPFLLVKKQEVIKIGSSIGLSAGASKKDTKYPIVGGLGNMLFWSPLQKEIFENPENLKVIFALCFGGGKSTMMKEKAIELAKQGEQVFYICMNGVDSNDTRTCLHPYQGITRNDERITQVTLFELLTRKELEKFGIKVINLLSAEVQDQLNIQNVMDEKVIKNDSSCEDASLVEFVKLHPDANFFIDDFYVRPTLFYMKNKEEVDIISSTKCLVSLSQFSKKTVWVALNYESIHNINLEDKYALDKAMALVLNALEWNDEIKKCFKIVDPQNSPGKNYRSGPCIGALTTFKDLCTSTQYEKQDSLCKLYCASKSKSLKLRKTIGYGRSYDNERRKEKWNEISKTFKTFSGVRPVLIPIFNRDCLEKAIFRGLEVLSSNVKVVIVKSSNENVFNSMKIEPEPYGKYGDTRPKIIQNQNFQIVKAVSEVCKEMADKQSSKFVCYTNKLQEGDINSFLENQSKTSWIILTDETLSQGIEATSVLYIDLAPQAEKDMGIGFNPDLQLPDYELKISKNPLCRAVVELVMIITYTTDDLMIGPSFRFCSFQNVDDLAEVPYIQLIQDFILKEHSPLKDPDFIKQMEAIKKRISQLKYEKRYSQLPYIVDNVDRRIQAALDLDNFLKPNDCG